MAKKKGECGMRQNIFSAQWKKTKGLDKPTNDGYKVARPYQKLAYKLLCDALYGIINSPTGSGKTLMTMKVASHRLSKDNQHRVIISVPQSNIANGYIEEHFKLGRKKIHWFTNHILCDTNGTIDHFIDLLSSTRDVGMEDRIIVCTHQTLVLAYKKMSKRKKKHILKNTTLFIDEAHHSLIEEEQNYYNNLGSVVNHYLKNRLSLIMITATFFRGDRLSVIPEKCRDRFVRFEMPFDEYIPYTGIKNFSFDFCFFEDNYISAFGQVYDPKKRTILYVPSTGTSCAVDRESGGKYREVDKILRSISDNGKYVKEKDGSISLVSKGKKIRAIDLVEERGRSERMKLISKSRADGKVDLIIAMRTFREGSDYPPLERIVVAGPRGSIGQIAQVVGRGFRDHKTKRKVEFIQLFPKVDREVRSQLNDYLNLIYCSMLLEEIISPIPKFGKRKKTEKHDYLAEQFPDADARIRFIESIFNQIIENAADGELKFDQFVQIVDERKELRRSEHRRKIAMQLWMMMVRRTVGASKFSKLDFKSIKHQDALGFLTRYTSGVCDIKTLKELRNCLNNFLPKDEFIKQLRATGIRIQSEYKREYKKHEGWPSDPAYSYGMKWSELVGKDRLPKDEFIKQLRATGIRIQSEYKREYKKHKGWPGNPAYSYGMKWNELVGKDLICTGKDFLPKDEFIKQLRATGIRTHNEYQREYKKHKGWPSNPQQKHGMKWNELVGKKPVGKDFLPKDEFIKQLRATGIRTHNEYQREYKKHEGWPGCFQQKYRMKWSELVGKDFLPKDEFIKQLRATGIRIQSEYKREYKKHKGWPSNPAYSYGMKWSEFRGK